MKSTILLLLTATLSFAQLNLGRPRTQAGTYAQRPACNSAIELYLFTDTGTLLNDSICDGTSWIDRRDGLEMKTPPSSWTWHRQGDSTQIAIFGRQGFDFTGNGLRGAWLPFTEGEATMCISQLYGRANGSGCNFMLVDEDGDGNNDNDKLMVFGPGGPVPNITASIVGQQGLTTSPYDTGNVDFECARVVVDPVNRVFTGYYSQNGVVFSTALIVPLDPPAIHAPFNPKGFGIECNGDAGIPQTVVVLHYE